MDAKAYAERIAAARAFVAARYADPVSLGDIAAAAGVSVYHFTRIFAAVVGSPPIAYLKSVRLAAAADRLETTGDAVARIALDCGFASLSAFNDQFKRRYGLPPRRYRESRRPGRQEAKSKDQAESGKGREDGAAGFVHTPEKSLLRRVWDMNVTIRERPECRVAYFRHVGSYLDTGANWERLLAWVGARGPFRPDALFIGISHDDPATTEDDACRRDACISLPESWTETAEGGAAYATIPAGRYAEYEFFGTVDKLALAYRSLYGEWLPASGYEADDRPILEINLNNPADDPERRTRCLVCLPIK